MSSKRDTQIDTFLQASGWGRAARSNVPGDASARRYFRLAKEGQKAVLMDAPPEAIQPGAAMGASPEERRKVGYNALARIAGVNSVAFVTIADALFTRGFSAPKVLASDLSKGFVLLEDLGDDLYARVIDRNSAMEKEIYEEAIDCLAAIYRSSFPNTLQFQNSSWPLRTYDQWAMLAEVDLFTFWYVPDLGRDIESAAQREWYDIWKELFNCFEAHAPGLALRDFHAENIFWLPERESIERVGLIDFQDGLIAHPSYDLVSLLEDARRDVSKELINPLIGRFCEKAGFKDDAAFRTAYAVMGAQRNAKIIGIFVRLAKRDGKPHYRDMIPRVAAHFRSNLESPAMRDLKAWITTHVPEILDA